MDKAVRMINYFPFKITQKDINYYQLFKEQNMKKKGSLEGQHIKGFDFLKLLGAGAWAEVYLAVNKNKEKCAIKVIGKGQIKETPKLQQLIATEIKVLKNCKSQNVIGYVDSFQTPQNLYIATEYCNGGDLEDYLNKKKKLIEDEAVMFLKQILNGFKGLHQVGAMHRDFKVANILLHNSICKIADLGFAKVIEAGNPLAKTILGTSLTMAPQVLDQKAYGMEADIWSVGVVFYQLLYGDYPYKGYSDYDILRKIKKDPINFSKVSISQKAKDFISRCMTVDPKKRITWAEIYEHPLIKEQKRGIIMGGLKSKISISENQEFYRNRNSISPSNLNKIPEVEMPQVQEDIRKSQYPNMLLQQFEKKEKMEEAFNQNQRIYLDHRNGIMFIVTYVEPYSRSLPNVKVNHSVALFLFFKVAYLKLQAFLYHIEKKTNFLEIKQFWEAFNSSSTYEQIKNVIKQDKNIVSAYCQSYKSQIHSCNEKVKAEFKIDAAKPTFKALVQEILDSYWFELAGHLQLIQGTQKQSLIKLMTALYYYKRFPYPNAQQFGNILMNINFQQAEAKIKEKVRAKMNVQ